MGHLENLAVAYVDATAAIGAVSGENQGVRLSGLFQRGPDHLRFGADDETIHAVVAGAALSGRDAASAVRPSKP
jgi:hypothetical protein